MDPNDLTRIREHMVEEQIIARGVNDTRVVAAMRNVPRHRFLPGRPISEVYTDRALPVGRDHNLSQPYIVAFMTESLALKSEDKVLEIGMASGYHAAVLAEVAGEVFAVEKLPMLAMSAWKVLNELGYDNIHYKIGDGTQGWPENGPYDAILVTTGEPYVPPALKGQLAPGGRMVIPVGERHARELVKIERTAHGFTETRLGDCRLVTLKPECGWN